MSAKVPENVPGEPHPGFENGAVPDLSPGYVPGEPDEGFANGSVLETHATNSSVVGSSNAEPVDQDEAGPPPKGGAGSGLDEWRAYADSVGVLVHEDMTRDEIIDAVESAEEH